MLHALYEEGVTSDLLVGTSAGALNAAFVASRPQRPATACQLASIWESLRRDDIFPVSLRAVVGGLWGQRDLLVSNRELLRLVGRYTEFEDLSEASIPLHVVAFDLLEGSEVLLSDGPALHAIAAAAAIPGVFPPVSIGKRSLIDGGVVNNTPISHAVELGAERIYVLAAQQPGRPLEARPQGAFDAAIYGLGLLIDLRFEADIARYSSEVELIVLPAPNPFQIRPTDFEHASDLIGQARAACREALGGADGPVLQPALGMHALPDARLQLHPAQ